MNQLTHAEFIRAESLLDLVPFEVTDIKYEGRAFSLVITENFEKVRYSGFELVVVCYFDHELYGRYSTRNDATKDLISGVQRSMLIDFFCSDALRQCTKDINGGKVPEL